MLQTILRNTPFSILVISAIFSCALSIATAQTTDTSTSVSATTSVGVRANTSTTPARRAEMEAMRSAFKERAAHLRTNAVEKLTSIADRIESRAHLLKERGVNAPAALAFVAEARIELRAASVIFTEDLAVEVDTAFRSESRAHLLKERGVNAPAALAFVAEARIELRAASVIFTEDLAVEVDTAVTDTDPKAAFAQVKESVREAGVHIHAAQKALRDAVAALKEAVTAQQPGVSDAVRNEP